MGQLQQKYQSIFAKILGKPVINDLIGCTKNSYPTIHTLGKPAIYDLTRYEKNIYPITHTLLQVLFIECLVNRFPSLLNSN